MTLDPVPGYGVFRDMESEKSFDSVRKLWYVLAPYKAKVLGLSLLISLSASLGTVSPQFIRYGLDVVVPSGEVNLFLWLAGLFAAFYLVKMFVGYASMYLSFAFTQSIISDIRMRAWSRMLRLPVVRFAEERSGSLVSRVVSDVNALEGMIQAGSTRLAGQLFSILVILVIVVIMNWKLALVNVVVTPLLALITRHYQPALRAASRRIRARVGEMTAVASEVIGNIQVVKVFAGERMEERKFGVENNAYVEHNLDRRKDVGYMEGLIGLTADYGIGAILFIGGWFVVQGTLTVGELTAFLMYQQMLQRPILSVMFFNNQLQAGMAALERVSELLDSDPETSGSYPRLEPGNIEFENVTFVYPGGSQPALQGVSFTIPEEATVAFVGPSGSGKSTLTRLLARFYDPQQGAVRIGGRDVRDMDLEALRDGLAMVPQEPTLFSGSVRDNIRYARPEASDADVERAARIANAHTFIEELPRGYDTEVGERGVKLSGGQKQRIAIARAMIKDARILVLDEATASLDSESEAVIQDALEGIFSRETSLTTIVIAHRLSTIQRAGTIFCLDHGALVESGTHSELMALDGLYARLHELQFREMAGTV
ncbi:MAG: ABC transporter ATP-binding protein [Bacteroidetes bacterium CG12_big_fil_rev_8_21_14_0_65_60_17]|nr:MAG: ABC transporter ATP-binding protein [Bacteroidetes bacterium CG12_big_fil_rev_8_21_14_0_65_60_17]